MTGYTTEEVARLLGLSPAQIRSYTRAAFLSPARAAGGRGELRFSFQDLVLLRAAKGLMAARIPAAKIRSSLRRLKQQLPRGRSEEHTSELQSRLHLVCRLLLEKKKQK